MKHINNTVKQISDKERYALSNNQAEMQTSLKPLKQLHIHY